MPVIIRAIVAALWPILRWIGSLLVRALAFLGPVLTWIGVLGVSLTTGIFQYLLDAVTWLILEVLGQLDPAMVAWLQQEPWAPLLPYLDSVNWFIPIYPLGAIIITTYGMVASLRVLRWLFSFQLLGTGGS